jgi:hypothetical protein
LQPAGGGTVLTFAQTGVPAKHARKINKGWKTHYWQPLKSAISRGL